MEESNKQFIVLGVMRSGTSLCSGMLSHLGVDMGKDRKAPDKYNPNGYFEDKEVFDLNTKLLVLSNGDNWKPVNIKKDIVDSYEENLKRIGKREGVWGCKGGTNLTIDAFMPYLKNPYFIIVYRNPISNIRSLRDYRNISFGEAMDLVLTYYKKFSEIINKYPDTPKYYFEFERAKQNPVEVAQELADFIGIKNFNKKVIKDFVYDKRI